MPRHPSPPISVDFDHHGTAYAILSYRIPQNPILRDLTPAELEVLELWLDGASAEEVASLRGCAVRTVNNQVASIYRKLGAGSRAELATMVRSPSAAPPPLVRSPSAAPPPLVSTNSRAPVAATPRQTDSVPPPASHRRPRRAQRSTPSASQPAPNPLSQAAVAAPQASATAGADQPVP